MSGVGKTRLAHLLRQREWFHYSGDFRIGTRYLDEAILDDIKEQAMVLPALQELLRTHSIDITHRITVDNLKPVSSFLGKLGDPERGGLPVREFKRRQELHRRAEINAMLDVPEFIRKAQKVYRFRHFINDAGGSVCELDEPRVLEVLAEHTLLVYIKATHEDEEALISRAERDPKPLYYRDAFLDAQLQDYMAARKLEYVALLDPDDFVRWIFPKLFYARIPRYDAIAERYGYTVTTTEVAAVHSEGDFLELVETAIRRAHG
jgi:hypothetical protein